MRKRTGGRRDREVARDIRLRGLGTFQHLSRQTIHGEADGEKRHAASLLGLASESGSILDAYKRYLRDSIDLSASREFLSEEIGDLLWYLAAVASASSLGLEEIGRENLRRTTRLYGRVQWNTLAPEPRPKIPEFRGARAIYQDFTEYQRRAVQTSRLSLHGPEGPLAPMFGLASATGSILDHPKRESEDIDLPGNRRFFLKELGDLLWYASAVAAACGLGLGDIAVRNVQRSHDLYTESNTPLSVMFERLPKLDNPRRPTECFPRRLVVRFEERDVPGGPPIATQWIVDAYPYAFPRGPVKLGRKLQGFKLGASLGHATTDNTRRADGYRYHDAIHLAFAAVLGWSPTTRRLLRLKRKSNPATDRDEDGARAIFTEEGLSAILSRLAPRRMGFLGENTVDGQVIATAKAAVQDLEAQCLPGWLWRRAISQGFSSMDKLKKNRGGYLIADLDKRLLSYSKTKPHAQV